MNVIFWGTPDFAIPSLKAIHNHPGCRLVLCVTCCAKPCGRGQKKISSPVQDYAEFNNIPFVGIEEIKSLEFLESIRNLEPDLFVTASFGKIMGSKLLELPRLGAINVHGSLLPRWRGAAPIQRSLMNGDMETGITIQKMVKKLDAGPILLEKKIPLLESDTYLSLHNKLATIGGELVFTFLQNPEKYLSEAREQNEALATYANKILKEETSIDWSKTAMEIFNHIRGLSPEPGAQTKYFDMLWKIEEACVMDEGIYSKDSAYGNIIKKGKKELDIQTRKGVIRILKLKPQNSKSMDIQAFLAGQGRNIKIGERLS